MAANKTPFEDLGRKVDRGAKRLEEEGEKLIDYLNNEVVPAIRSHSSKALRIASEKLSQLANYMDQKGPK